MLVFIQLTFRESFAKKTFMAFWGISTLICLVFIFALNLDIVDGAQTYISVFGQESNETIDLHKIISGLQGGIAVFLFTGGLFLSLFATSNLVPSMLKPGNIDLLISKPLSRFEILLGRYLGGVSIVSFNVLYLILFSWFILSIKTGIWNFGYLWSGITIILTFAILYAMMVLFSLLTGSGPFSLMITYLILFFSPLLLQRDAIYALLSNRIYGYILDGIYYFLPKTAELGYLTQVLVQGEPVTTWMPLWTSALFGVFMMWVSTLYFKHKNF